MRKAIISALMMTLLLLPGCGEREVRLEKSFDELRAAVTAAQSISFETRMTADWGDTTADYTLAVTYDGQETVQEILSPELLKGVRARALRGQTSVDYDGVILGAGPLDGEGLSPMSAVPVILDALASAYVELLWWDGDTIAARLYVGEQSVATVWLDSESLALTAAEIACDGRTVISCRVSGWEIS